MLILLQILVAIPAIADRQVTIDPDDSKGPLDLVYGQLSHRNIDGRHYFKVRAGTYESWDARLLNEGSEKRWISLEFNLDEDSIRERRVFVTYQEGNGLVARMYGPGFGDPEMPHSRFLGFVAVRRPDNHSVSVTFRRKLLGANLEHFSWLAGSSYEDDVLGSSCPIPDPHGDGGYGSCRDFTRRRDH